MSFQLLMVIPVRVFQYGFILSVQRHSIKQENDAMKNAIWCQQSISVRYHAIIDNYVIIHTK